MKFPPFRGSNSGRHDRGAALITILAIITILAALLLSYLVTTQVDRQSTSNYSQSIKADELALGGLQEITSRLKKEIEAGSSQDSKYTVDGEKIFYPLSNNTLNPARLGYPATAFSTDVDATLLPPTLLQVSRRQGGNNAYPGEYVAAPLTLASPASTSKPSFNNGRSISSARWNKPLLMGALNSGTTNDAPTTFSDTPPDWVYVTREGSKVLSDARAASGSLVADAAGNNNDAVIGRYAYVIYDEGALLDINVAGTPASALSSPEAKQAAAAKSFVAYADLSIIPGLSQGLVDELATWRNQGGANLYPTHTTMLSKAAKNGFTQFWNNDNPLLSRQDMIDYLTQKGAKNAIPYLATFSRATNAPSAKPTSPPEESTDSDLKAVMIRYVNEANNDAASNRDLANVRSGVDATFHHYDDDGVKSDYEVKAGDPLIQHRFSLGKLGWLTYEGPRTDIDEDAIEACFGLKWDSANLRWVYQGTVSVSSNDGTNTTSVPHVIKTLAEVAQDGREPNFFELLKASILSRSLGKDPGPVAQTQSTNPKGYYPNPNPNPPGPGTPDYSGVSGTLFDTTSAVKDEQIFRIGANIIDQADSDSYPTAIYCPLYGAGNPVTINPLEVREVANTFVGMENLPYLTRLMQICLASKPGSYGGPGTDAGIKGEIRAWLQPEIWNPHQSVQTGTATNKRPTDFRVRTYGEAATHWFQYIVQPMPPATNTTTVVLTTPTTVYPYDYTDGDQSKGMIYFSDSGGTSSSYYKTPKGLTPSLVNTGQTDPDCIYATSYTWDTDKKPFAGIYSGALNDYRPKYERQNVPYAGFAPNMWVRTLPLNEMSVVLEYNAGGGKWRPYSQMLRISAIASTNMGIPSSQADEINKVGTSKGKLFYGRVDPRTDRFSASYDWPNWANNRDFAIDKTVWEQNGSDFEHSFGAFVPRRDRGFTYAGTPNAAQYYLGDWMINNPSAGPTRRRAYYADQDTLVRPADGYRSVDGDSQGSGRMTYMDSNDYTLPRRPVILDRPFRSVGELGYVFRDEPFKSLDFWTERSGDMQMLDVFSVADEPRVTAGLVHINNAPKTILQSILQGAGRKALDPSDTNNLSETVAKDLADDMAGLFKDKPIANRTDLVSSPKLREFFDQRLSAAADKSNKAYAETPVRALASVIDTRTWSLLVDVIAQSGRIPVGANNLNEFMVEGEKRYWLHLAIDRYTGKVIDQQLEPVYE